jgi:hypothetical protein
MPKTITLRVSEDHYEVFKEYARMENRNISNAIETLALKQIEKIRFANEDEMDGILSDDKLVRRIKAGAKQAKERKGRFVE